MPDGCPTLTPQGGGRHGELEVHVGEASLEVRKDQVQVMHPWDGRGAVDRSICRIKMEKRWGRLTRGSKQGEEGWEFCGEKVDWDRVLKEGIR